MARFLKQSTAVDIMIGPFLDETDGKTAETGLTLTQPDIRLSKNGGAFAQKSAAQTLSHGEAGFYSCNLSTTDTDTIGRLRVAVHESGALPVWEDFHVLAANVFDSLFGAATDKLDVNVEEWNATAVPSEHTAGYPIVTIKDGTGTGEINTNAGAVALVDAVTIVNGLAADTITNASIENNALSSGKLASGTIQQATLADGLLTAAKFGASAITSTVLADGAITDAKVADDVKVAVNSFTTAALAALFTTDSGETYADAVAGSVVAEIADNASGGGGGLTQADVRAAVGLASANLDTQLAAIDDAVDTEVAAIKAKTDQLVFTGGRVDANVPAADVRSAVGMASANLDTQLSTIDTVVDAVKAKTDNLPASPAAVGSAMTLTSGERDAVAAALLNLANSIEADLTVKQAIRLIAAATAGKVSGGPSGPFLFRSAVADDKTRINAVCDSDGNRTAITYDVTD